jgi:hypothetical protein
MLYMPVIRNTIYILVHYRSVELPRKFLQRWPEDVSVSKACSRWDSEDESIQTMVRPSRIGRSKRSKFMRNVGSKGAGDCTM